MTKEGPRWGAPHFPVVLRHVLVLAPDEAYPVAPPLGGTPMVVIPINEGEDGFHEVIIKIDPDNGERLAYYDRKVVWVDDPMAHESAVDEEVMLGNNMSVAAAVSSAAQYVFVIKA